jgi:hypothetical protein
LSHYRLLRYFAAQFNAMPRSLIVLIGCFATLLGHTQADSSRLRISLLTCTPGEPLYATFGHTAIRVTDSAANSDIVYNYGTFNFDDDGFYLKFVRGKLNYYLSSEYFYDFVGFYQQENRGITEQVLRLNGADKKALQQALETNLRPENRFYKYDFFFDNCTTRAKDMLARLGDSAQTPPLVMPLGTTFRHAIHQYLDRNHGDWNKLGIDILLGSPTDAVMQPRQMQFLPDNLMAAMDSGRTLVTSKQYLYALPAASNAAPWATPMWAFALLAGLVVAAGFSKNGRVQLLLRSFDRLLLFLVGLLGLILVLMWTATDHAMCRNNYNLLWAWPTHAVMAFWMNSPKKWVRSYFGITALALLLLAAAWFFLPQQMNNALLPLILLLAYRCFLKWRTGNG